MFFHLPHIYYTLVADLITYASNVGLITSALSHYFIMTTVHIQYKTYFVQKDKL